MGKLSIVDEAMPARFTAPWPAVPDGIASDRWARSHALWGVHVGDPSAEQPFEAAIRSGAAQGLSGVEMGRAWVSALMDSWTPRYCGSILDRIERASTPAHQDALWMLAAECGLKLPAARFAQPGVPDEAVRRWTGPGGSLDPTQAMPDFPLPTDLDEVLDARRGHEWLDAHPGERQVIVDRAAALAQTADFPLALYSATFLAEVDWGRARAAWTGRTPQDPLERALIAALSRFESRRALVDHLRALGFTPRKDLQDAADARLAVTAEEVLHAWGRVHSEDLETGRFPNRHDDFLRDLARIAGIPASEVCFDEVPPSSSRVAEPYVLHAWTAGKRLTTPAENGGDWYDLQGVQVLFQGVLDLRGGGLGQGVVYTGDQVVTVVVGPAEGIAALFTDGLLTNADADFADE